MIGLDAFVRVGQSISSGGDGLESPSLHGPVVLERVSSYPCLANCPVSGLGKVLVDCGVELQCRISTCLQMLCLRMMLWATFSERSDGERCETNN